MNNLNTCLDKLNELLAGSLISQEEYDVKRKALLDQFIGLSGGPHAAAPVVPRRAPFVYRGATTRLTPAVRGFGGRGFGGGYPVRPALPTPLRLPRPSPYPQPQKQVLAEAGTGIKVQPVPDGVDEKMLAEAFGEFGNVVSAAVHRGSPPYGHVNFASRREASQVAAMERFDWGGQVCRVTLSRKRWEAVGEAAPNNGIGIFNLPLHMTYEELYGLLSGCPGLLTIKMVHNRVLPGGQGGEFRGYAFAYFDTVENATLAKSQLLGTTVGDQVIEVKFSIRPLEEAAQA